MTENKYPALEKFSRTIGIRSENLIKAFEIEKAFHKEILGEKSFEKRQKLIQDVYATVHPIYGINPIDTLQGKNPKDALVHLFRKELKDKSVLDVGCGEGHFLASISKNLPHKRLVGIDVSLPHLPKHHPDIQFMSTNIVDFNLNYQFDVVFSDNVLEHIAPADLSIHLQSIELSLKSGGVFIVRMPNRLFGPSDVTRIIDFSYSGKTIAQGTHLNESTYSELIPILEIHGFTNFRTIWYMPPLRGLLFSNCRLTPWPLQLIERNSFLLGILHRIKVRGQCFARFEITLICNKR